jgi:hypothetical protein
LYIFTKHKSSISVLAAGTAAASRGVTNIM